MPIKSSAKRTAALAKIAAKSTAPPAVLPKIRQQTAAGLTRKPVKLETGNELLLFRCPECQNLHFRHAGYFELQTPFIKAALQAETNTQSAAVTVCTKCKACFIWIDNTCYDVTKLIDLQAWDKTENELHKATGPGGEC